MPKDVNESPRTIADLLRGEDHPARRRLTRAMVEDEALALIDEAGLEATTMRAVAGRLAVTPRALYRHVADKHDLLRGVTGRILTEVRLPSSALPWDARVEGIMSELRRVMSNHPHAVALFTHRVFSAPAAVVVITDAVVGALTEAGISAEDAVRIFYAMFNYTIGFVVLGGTDSGDEAAASNPFAHLDPAAVPHAVSVADFLQRFADQGLRVSDEQFRFGLRLLLHAIEPPTARDRR
jgi:AcrR family transcriptional regulator